MVYHNTVNCFNKKNDTTGTLQDVMKIMFLSKSIWEYLKLIYWYAIKVLCSSIKEWILTVWRKRSDDTPLPTPSYQYNTWMKNKKKIPYTPKTDEKGIVEAGHLCWCK